MNDKNTKRRMRKTDWETMMYVASGLTVGVALAVILHWLGTVLPPVVLAGTMQVLTVVLLIVFVVSFVLDRVTRSRDKEKLTTRAHQMIAALSQEDPEIGAEMMRVFQNIESIEGLEAFVAMAEAAVKARERGRGQQ